MYQVIISLLAGMILGLLLALVLHDTAAMNYFEGRALIGLISSLEDQPEDYAKMCNDLRNARGKNGHISQYEFDHLFRDAAVLKYRRKR